MATQQKRKRQIVYRHGIPCPRCGEGMRSTRRERLKDGSCLRIRYCRNTKCPGRVDGGFLAVETIERAETTWLFKDGKRRSFKHQPELFAAQALRQFEKRARRRKG